MKCSRWWRVVFIVDISIWSTLSFTQPLPPPRPEEFVDAIEDNSFFIEEAFNQEEGVVQHISTGTYYGSPQKSFLCSFTQEWPLSGQRHQMSYTIPYSFLDGNSISGVGDILINYRYQLFSADDWAAAAPRISIVLPTGSIETGLGAGVVGAQLNLPVSKRLSNEFIAHLNVGTMLLPRAKGKDAAGNEVRHTLTSYNLGGSVIYLASKGLNFLLEINGNFLGEIDNNGNVARATETVVSPGVRCAVDVGSLQIVPGFAVPISLLEGDLRTGAFLYLSLEHPF